MQSQLKVRQRGADTDAVIGIAQLSNTVPIKANDCEKDEGSKTGISCYAEGTPLFQMGQKATAGYQVLSGAVLLCRIADGKKVQVLEAHGEKEIIGISSDANYDHSAVAMTRTIARRIDQAEIRQSLQMQELIAAQLTRSLARLRKRIPLYGRKTAPCLVASALVELPRCVSHRLASADQHHFRDMRVMMSPTELASCLNLTTTTVRGVLTNLKADGVIGICGRRLLVIRDLAALQSLERGGAFLAHPQCYYEENNSRKKGSGKGAQK